MTDEAAPFVLGALLAILGACTSWFVERRSIEYAGGTGGKKSGLDPSNAPALAAWAADASQAFVVTAAPLIASLVVFGGASSTLGIAYTIVMVAGLGTLGRVLFMSPDDYSSKPRLFGLAPIPLMGVVLNALAAVIAQVATS